MIEVALAALTPVRWQDATIVARQPQTPNITSFLLRPVTPLQWYAGQHVDIRLTAADGYRAVRSYSIASAPNGSGVIELAIERLADGEVSPFFHDIALVGDVIEMKGPLGGHFVWRPVDHGPVLLVGAGSGLVPLLAMIRHRAATRCAPVSPASLSPDICRHPLPKRARSARGTQRRLQPHVGYHARTRPAPVRLQPSDRHRHGA
jgi:NAD(P)H-flavin reductase